MPRQEPETIRVTRAAFHGGDGQWKTCDDLENNGRKWMVGRWIAKENGTSVPERMVLMDGLDVTNVGPSDVQVPVDWMVLTPLPDSIFKLGTSIVGGFYVVDHPNIPVKLPR